MQIGITLYTHQHTLEVSSTALKLDPYVDFHQELIRSSWPMRAAMLDGDVQAEGCML